MPRQNDALEDFPELASAAAYRRVAIDIIDQAYWAMPGDPPEGWPGTAAVALEMYLAPPFHPTPVTAWVERVLREALRG